MSHEAENLVGLALCEETLTRLERERRQIPETSSAEQAKRAAADEALAAERTHLEDTEHRRREREAELRDTEARRDKFQGQTALVKTNQEYTALLGEIDAASRRMSELEDEILEAMEIVDTAKAHLRTAEGEHVTASREVQRVIDELGSRLTEVEKELEVRRGEEQERLARLDANARSTYKRIQKRMGTAMARVVRGSCSACYRDVPPEKINRVMAGGLLPCGNCGRILVLIAEAEGELE